MAMHLNKYAAFPPIQFLDQSRVKCMHPDVYTIEIVKAVKQLQYNFILTKTNHLNFDQNRIRIANKLDLILINDDIVNT